MPFLILIRHGNTFEAGETPRRVGGRTDLSLTAEGERQGAALASMLAASFAPIDAVATGPLQRTRRFAEMIAQAIKRPFTPDERLREIDFGLWENKTDDQLRALYGAGALQAWDNEGIWPDAMNWAPSREEVEDNVSSLLDEQRGALLRPDAGNRVLVTSNGILRFFHRALAGTTGPEAKVKTGRYCLIAPAQKGWTMTAWNKAPQEPAAYR